ncbi:TetR/AcrR family transcriptional regulator [Barnesiella viscericola]|uniref:TetR/AcrR family transcriptional regulator n=1 Tax=Barnesiella viscericola TaxID=397865 RepID=A0A921MSS2_9BACT|nr:TetR/AcrR family transcriptional regulator [Barnesiella viscericola]HJG89757.1 TetR/AcrR family transcriptional regulator [Barnesiella viscericola]
MKTKDTEADILKAAEQEFMLRGFDGAKTASIARAAGVTHAMLHYYFRSKELLFDRILTDKMRLMGQSVLTAFGNPGLPPLDRLKDGISRHFDFLMANPDLPRFIINEVFSRPERYELMRGEISRIVDRLMQSMQHELDKLAGRGEIESVDVRHLLLDIVCLNVFPFIAYPLIEPVFGSIASDRSHFFEMRKAENIEVIMRRIKKQEL